MTEPRRPTIKECVHDPSSSGLREEARAKTDQPSRGNAELKTNPSGTGVLHLCHLTATNREQLRQNTDVVLRGINDQLFQRLVYYAFDFPGDDCRLRDLYLIAFAAHRLDQDRELQFLRARSPAEHPENQCLRLSG